MPRHLPHYVHPQDGALAGAGATLRAAYSPNSARV
jgi:hypothetical protein